MNCLTASARGARILILTVFLLLMVAAGSALAKDINFDTWVDDAVSTPAPITGHAMGHFTTSLTGGGGTTAMTSTTVDITGTVLATDIAAVTLDCGGTPYTVNSPGSKTGIVINTSGGGGCKAGGSNFTYTVDLNASAGGKTIGLTVQAAGPVIDNVGMPVSSSTVSVTAPDTLSVAGNTPVASSASAGAIDLEMQYLQVDSDNADDGQVEITTVTVDDLGTAAGGDIDNINVYIDDDTDLGNGDLGKVVAAFSGAQLNVDMTSISAANRTVSFGTSKYIWITYDLNGAIADGTGLQSSVTSIAVAGGENGASGTWNSNNFNTSSGPSNTLTSCADCHDYPPADSTGSRGTPAGSVVGDHTKHNAYTCNFCHVIPATETSADFKHRDGDINVKPATIGDAAAGDNGSYSRGATFAQSNSPTTGTCSNVNCHNNAVTPQWGVGTTSCGTCHNLPPATGAHNAHYTAKGWANDETNCTACHPDNTGGHSDVTDSTPVISLTYAGGSCSNAPAGGCHNDQASTPIWSSGTATCTDCHTVGGVNTGSSANPVSGLHDMTAAGVQKHDDTLGGSQCEECHTKASISGHWDGTNGGSPPNYTSASVGISFASGSYTDAGGTGASRGTCNTTCHADGGAWERQWSTAANSTVTTAGDTRCDVCHGQMGSWRTGTSHEGTFGGGTSTRGAGHNSLGGGANACEDCHSYPSLSNHEDGNVTVNDGGATGLTESGGRAWCSSCHSDDGAPTTSGTHTFTQADFTLATVSGANDPVGGCTNCHGGGTSGATESNFWPDESTAHAANDDPNGRHLKHMTELANTVYGLSITGLLDDGASDTKQKALCEYCHAANSNDSDHTTTYPADVFVDADTVRHANALWGAADGNAAYSAAADTCSNVDCHNSKTTTDGTYGWYDAGTSTCTMCHVGGTTNGTSGLHTGTPTVSGTTHDETLDATECAICHTSNPSATHIDGTPDTPTTFDAAIGFNGVPNPPTCTASSCHSDGGAWERKWHANATDAVSPTSNACAGCHGTFTTGFNTGVSVRHSNDAQLEASHDGTDKCVTCHAYDGADTYGHKWATHHMDNKIQISDQAGFVDNGGTVGCGSCHANNDGTADGQHEFTDASAANGWSTTSRIVAGPTASCNSCHDTGGGGSPQVSAASTHVDADGGGGTYAAGTCTDCHNGHANGTTGVNDVEIDTDVPILTAGTYSSHAGGAIQLGGDATAGYSVSTEAELCWNCHDDNAISEWGKTWGSYQTGNVNVSNWTTANWSSAIAAFNYKNGNIGTLGSVHGTAGMATKAADAMTMTTGEAPGAISCTYCHDVHMVKKTVGGYDPVATPYLRGNWTSNVYTNDGAPMATHDGSWGAGDARGSVPRAAALLNTAGNNEEGGWQIEQNNGRNDSAQTYANYGGICQSCHTEAGIKTGWGPHGAVVAGFTGSSNDIFDNSFRGGDGTYQRGHIVNAGTDDTRGQGAGKSSYIGALRNSNQWSDGINPPAGKPQYTPLMQPQFTTGAVTTLTTSGNVAQANFHNFMCSKCHQPHASRLPRLMITNCLDVEHNTWDDTYSPASWGAGTFASTELAYSPTAGNCHRYVDSSTGKDEAGNEGGWNTVTPW